MRIHENLRVPKHRKQPGYEDSIGELNSEAASEAKMKHEHNKLRNDDAFETFQPIAAPVDAKVEKAVGMLFKRLLN